MPLRPKPEVENLKICAHGGINYAEFRATGLNPETVLDFSVCTNPFMPPRGIRKVIDNTVINRYPDSESTELRQRLSERLGVATDSILVGSGTTELIRLIATAYFSKGDRVLISEPTYGEYEIACNILGAEVVKQVAREENNFAFRIEETIDLTREHQPRAVFICNPNNPSGQYLSQQEVEVVSDALSNGMLILDEAYVAFVENGWPSTALISRGNVIILHSMTKDYGLAGVRLGYALASPDIIGNLQRVCPPWNVNVIAQKMGLFTIDNPDYLEQSIKKTGEAKKFLVNRFSNLGFRPLPSDANFFLVKVGDAREFRTALLGHGIMVRDCASFGLPEYVRIAPRTMPECRKLIAAIESVLQSSRKGPGI